ncbi:MAG: ZIP family metal transporter [Bacteroidales bacterium]|nr:ZIP family metal transporter [Bacteroidales bacterium]MBN2761967.1 ZIP family metal transporter [Bacteroidales bacterium]
MTADSNTFIWILVFAILAAIINGVGILILHKFREWAEKAKPYFMCFAAGVLISTPLMLAMPQAIQKNFYAGFMALLGYLFMFFSNELIKKRTQKEVLAFGIVAAEGIGIHSFIDGIVYTVTFSISILTGFLAATGLVIHEFAEGIITYTFFLKGGVKEKKAMLYAFLVAGLTTPLGAFVAYPLINQLSQSTLGLILGFTAGVLIYISSSHLLPEARGEEKKHSSYAFISGVGLAVFIVLSKVF